MTWVILILNVVIWALDVASGPLLGQLIGVPIPNLLLELGAKRTDLILSGQLWRLVTPIFLHIGLLHLAFNSYAIYVIGPQIECFFGPRRFLSIYLLSGIYGVLMSFAFSAAPSAGASGAIFGLIGTQAVFFYRYRNAFGERGRRQLQGTLLVIAFNLVLTFSASRIDVWGHIGGLAAGAMLGWYLTPRYALAIAGDGSASLVDRNDARHWSMPVVAATVLLIIGTWLAIAVQTPR
ncbi:MAG: rhomboid family intramembrane serine protease [Anaerolineae bacterium]